MPMRLLVSLPVAVVALVVVGRGRTTARSGALGVWAASVAGAWLITLLVNFADRLRGVLHREQPEADGRLARLLLRAQRLPRPGRPLSRRRCARVVEWLPFRYQIGFPVEIMTGAHDRARRARPAGGASGSGSPSVSARRPCCGARAAALRGVRRLRACPAVPWSRATRACSACSCAPRCCSRCSTAPTSCSTALIGRLLDRAGDRAALRRLPRRARPSPAGRFGEALDGHRLVHVPRRGCSRARINPSLVDGGGAHPQGDARLRAAQAGRRAVPGVDRALPAVARDERRHRVGHLRLGLPPARARARRPADAGRRGRSPWSPPSRSSTRSGCSP